MVGSRPTGTLFIVSTPIGNLRDITLRALDTLKAVAWVAAEDTRRTRKLLSAHDIKARLLSVHANSGPAKIDKLFDQLRAGADVAYVTDAGSPSISDPGVMLVDRAHNDGIPVAVVPGASALTAAIAAAGLPSTDVRFLGFLPRSQSRRQKALEQAAQTGCALVLFESPRRVHRLLDQLAATLPNRQVAMCRELTKLHEEVARGTASDLTTRLPSEVRGEVALVVGPEAEPARGHTDLEAAQGLARELVSSGAATREAAFELASAMGLTKRQAYGLLLEAKKEQNG